MNKISTPDNARIKLIMVRSTCIGTDCQTKYAFLLPAFLFTEPCMNTPNHNQCDMCIKIDIELKIWWW